MYKKILLACLIPICAQSESTNLIETITKKALQSGKAALFVAGRSAIAFGVLEKIGVSSGTMSCSSIESFYNNVNKNQLVLALLIGFTGFFWQDWPDLDKV